MEYMADIKNKLRTIDETDIQYHNLFNFPELFYGSLNFTTENLDLSKFPKNILNEMKEYGSEVFTGINYYNYASCGNRLRFSTSSSKIIFKIKLKRKWPYQKIINWNSMGFDIFSIEENKYVFKSIFSPMDGYNIFSEILYLPPNTPLCIFLPSYNIIEEMYIGIEKDATITKVDYPKNKQVPIIFFGNSITQGAAASRSGNTFPNIISRKLNRDIINISSSSGCIGTESIAELIGKINCHSIIIDYTKNAPNIKFFLKTYEKFYKRIRDFHPNKKIILLTTGHFNEWNKNQYKTFDKIVESTYKNAIKKGENTYLINQQKLFEKNEWDYIAVDAGHYTDYGMYKIADTICEILIK